VKKRIIDELFILASQLREAKMQAQSLGIFTNDSELLECPVCGLLEDVTIEGLLITYKEDNSSLNEDSGLRFREIDGTHRFVCPACGTTITVDDEDVAE
jgi:predicted RNA-binding Zn-ribbon protein involved in translation (DUF1610 family)